MKKEFKKAVKKVVPYLIGVVGSVSFVSLVIVIFVFIEKL